MSTALIGHAALIVHTYVAADDSGYRGLRDGLAEVRRALGLTVSSQGEQPMPELAGMPDGWSMYLDRPDHDDGVFQAMLRRAHDVLILSVALAPAGAVGWASMEERWESLRRCLPGAVLGSVRVHQGEVEPWPAGDDLAAIAASIASEVPGSRADPPWQDGGSWTAGRVAVWETGVRRTVERHLLVLGPPGSDEQLSAWTWSSGGTGLSPLTRYQMHAAKLRFEADLVAPRTDGIRRRRERVATESRAVLDLLGAARTTPMAEREVDALLARCYDLEADLLDLTDTGGELRALDLTLDIAATNMAAVDAAGPAGVVADDQLRAAWLRTEIADLLIYIDTVRTGARDVVAVARDALQRRATDFEQHRQHRHDRFSLIQTSVIGAVLVALATIQSLGYKLPLDEAVQPGVVATLGGLALWLGLTAARMALRVRSGEPAPWRWRIVEAVAAGLTGAALAWATSSFVRVQLLALPTSVPLNLGCAAAGLAAGFLTTAMWRRR